MVFFDITASAHGRTTMVDVIERAADQCFMPLTVGGGIKSVEDMYTMLRAGADKISINSSALANPGIDPSGGGEIRQPVHRRLHRCQENRGGQMGCVLPMAGRKDTGLDAVEWAAKAVPNSVAGEIVLNSIDADGTKVRGLTW